MQGHRDILPLGLLPLGLRVLDVFLSFCCMKEFGDGFGCVIFARFFLKYRDGNCNCLPLNTARWLLISNNLQEFFVHAVLYLDSLPRRLFQNFRFWLQNSYFVKLARYFFLPSSSICDNQVLFSSDESPGHTLPIRSCVFQTLVFFICTILPRCHPGGIFVIDNKIPSHFEPNS